jgi:hypothetical protein
MTITFKDGAEPGKIIMCFIIRKTISEQKRTILITLYFTGAKNINKINHFKVYILRNMM